MKHNIQLLEYINTELYNDINQLQACCTTDGCCNLKLELDYKLYIGKKSDMQTNHINEFLYYIDDTLVSYVGISCFDGTTGEINGMTHPDWSRNRYFHRLIILALDECKKRGFSKTLLLTDDNSVSGNEFIKSIGGVYDTSEYRMKRNNNMTLPISNHQIDLRKALLKDTNEINRQDAIFFGDDSITITNNEDITCNLSEKNFSDMDSPYEEGSPNTQTYMITLDNKVIGKIKVECNETSSFIFGFGILPDFRGKGYGKAALQETLRFLLEKGSTDIQLDVVCSNNNALGLYKSCGFEEVSIMNYYRLP
jgi:GNAT superfamily N-acetyltransferase